MSTFEKTLRALLAASLLVTAGGLVVCQGGLEQGGVLAMGAGVAPQLAPATFSSVTQRVAPVAGPLTVVRSLKL